MAFVATSPSNYTPPPPGMHIARCYRLIDLGTQPKTYRASPSEKPADQRIVELLGEDRMDDGKPFTINKSWFFCPLHRKGRAHKDLESGAVGPAGRRAQL